MKNTRSINPSIFTRLQTLFAMAKKELIVMTRYPVNFVTSFIQMFLIVTIFTFAGLAFSPNGESNTTISGLIVYGFGLFIFLSDSLWMIGYNIYSEQKQGTLEALYLSPASKFSSLVSRTINLLVLTGLLVAFSVWVMSKLLGEIPFQNPGLGLFLLIMNLTGIFGLGFAFAGLTLRLKETAQTMVNLMQFFFMIFSAMFFPFSALPSFLFEIARWLPVSHGVDIFRSTLMGYPPGFPELAPINVGITITTAWGLLMPVFGYYLYRRAEKRVRENGSLGQY